MSDAWTINVLLEHDGQLIDDSMSIIDGSRVMLLLVASDLIVIYDHHIFIVQATGLPAKEYNNNNHLYTQHG
jgi:hypothetical protein